MCGLHAVDDRGAVLTLSRSGVRRRLCLHACNGLNIESRNRSDAQSLGGPNRGLTRDDVRYNYTFRDRPKGHIPSGLAYSCLGAAATTLSGKPMARPKA